MSHIKVCCVVDLSSCSSGGVSVSVRENMRKHVFCMCVLVCLEENEQKISFQIIGYA